MPVGRPPQGVLVLTEENRRLLLGYTRRAKSKNALSQRARIVLRLADGIPASTIAKEMQISNATVGKWRKRYIDKGVEGLLDEKRSGAPRKVTDEAVEKVLIDTLESTPRDATHWSTRQMAKKSGLSHMTVQRIWQAFGLQPHRVDSFRLSNDPQFIEKVRDIVGLYLNPPEAAVVLCVDEKSQIQALERSQPIIPMRPGIPERQTHDYQRNGTTSLFAALNVATGSVITDVRRSHAATEFKKFLVKINKEVPKEFEVHLIMDNYATHKTPLITQWLARRPRFHVHFTPTYSSWINQVERWFALLTDRWIRRGSFTSVRDLETKLKKWAAMWNENPHPFTWVKTADDILASVERFCERTSGTGH